MRKVSKYKAVAVGDMQMSMAKLLSAAINIAKDRNDEDMLGRITAFKETGWKKIPSSFELELHEYI